MENQDNMENQDVFENQQVDQNSTTENLPDKDGINDNSPQSDNIIAYADISEKEIEVDAAESNPIVQSMPPLQPAMTDEERLALRRREIYMLQEELKKEEARAKAEKKKKRKEKGMSFWQCALVSLIFTFIGCVVTITILMTLPASYFDNSVLGSLISSDTEKKENTNTNANVIVNNGEDTAVGGTVVESGSNVTINVETDEIATAVYAKANQSVVGITVVSSTSGMPWESSSYSVSGSGSGIVYSIDGLIVTNYHVIEAALSESGKLASGNEVRVYLDTSLDTYFKAELKGYDKTTDLAVLKINASNLKSIDFADSDKIEIGETAVVIGSPGGLEFMNSVSSGIVSGLNRNLTTSSGIAYNLIQTTAAINPGNSGGALLNAEGELIGICVLKVAASNYEGMGFAISSNTVKSVVDSIASDGHVTRPQLGVTINNNYTTTEAEKYNMPAGAWVYSVGEDSAAEKAGIESGDIIVGIDDKTITSYYELRTELLKHAPGDSIKIKLYRDGKYVTVTAVLDKE